MNGRADLPCAAINFRVSVWPSRAFSKTELKNKRSVMELKKTQTELHGKSVQDLRPLGESVIRWLLRGRPGAFLLAGLLPLRDVWEARRSNQDRPIWYGNLW